MRQKFVFEIFFIQSISDSWWGIHHHWRSNFRYFPPYTMGFHASYSTEYYLFLCYYYIASRDECCPVGWDILQLRDYFIKCCCYGFLWEQHTGGDGSSWGNVFWVSYLRFHEEGTGKTEVLKLLFPEKFLSMRKCHSSSQINMAVIDDVWRRYGGKSFVPYSEFQIGKGTLLILNQVKYQR